ncbi:DUF3298 and DUF4163 domain-containing protein [Abyssibacter sp.]|uniref:DUF3298 and DUF4163 domain-containing protein n=1 Tax=Abyssibacter sp. TaxID=2320200 RepID=UPI0025BCD413|nr:DUF3298 and DUF4163 domain-containing protein [Abyssibacter sp.]MCK5860413.1 DUF3298 and DUF4163 domain-containing protein [Abyssibacter sp.]
MNQIGILEIFVSLGVPGLALFVFWSIFKAFHWDFPKVPQKWVAPIIIIFMLLTAVITLYALTLWKPVNGNDPSSRQAIEESAENQRLEKKSFSEKVTVTKKVFSREYPITVEGWEAHGTLSVTINYPEIRGHPDNNIQRSINKLLKERAGLFNNHEKEQFDHVSDYDLKSNKNNIISFTFIDHGVYVGAATSVTHSSSLNINLVNGAPFELKDLFRSGYHTFLSDLITEQKLCGPAKAPVYDNQDFYFTESEVVIIYSRGEICARAAGVIEAKVNLDRLSPIINPNGPLYYLIN